MQLIRRHIFYKISIIALLLLIVLLISLRGPEDINNLKKISIIEQSIRIPMNQVECRHPHVSIYNPEIMKFYKPSQKIDCGNSSQDWVKCEKSHCFVKAEIISNHGAVVCSYTDLIRKNDYKIKYGKTTKTKKVYVLNKSDFVKVVCTAESGSSWFGMAYGIRNSIVQKKKEQNAKNKHTAFNVVMFGFDSLSRNAFIRKLPKTYDYMTRYLKAIVLEGYNIVGDGTPQALIPLLTGYTELELPETRKRISNSQNVDVYPMIWKDFAKQGYITSFNEDSPNIGTFTYRMKGFNEQPVHHYLRTFYVEVQNSWSSNKEFCIGHQADHFVMLDYTMNLMENYFDTPCFIFSFHGALSHDSINLIDNADDDMQFWLKNLKEKNLLNNTILILMSDHGNRFADVRSTLQGKQEERLPFFSFIFPELFKTMYPLQYETFINNSKLLTTPFDVHATLTDILKLSSSEDVSTPRSNVVISKFARRRAISLFNPIPKNRSCADAYIEPHWCACLQWQKLQTNETSVKALLVKAAYSIIDTINNATRHYRNLCAILELHKINWGLRLLPHKEMLNYKGNIDADGYLADMSDKMSFNEEIFQLQIVVNPGFSIFEGSVKYNLRSLIAEADLSQISRVNKYGSQANCILERDPEIRKYCYCRT